jgi:glycosyltransferase involved in cell wall biosynthesis
MTVSVITPTCDRPVAFGLCERWMARQTRQPDEWIVADGGQTPAVCTLGQRHLHQPSAPGFGNFLGNLRRGLDAATGDVLVWWEDDDWYHTRHLEAMLELFASGMMAVGDDLQQYYNLEHRVWRTFNNKGASLCQTAMTRGAIPCFRKALDAARHDRSYGVDGRFWAMLPKSLIRLSRIQTVVGMKGLPGAKGLGIGHRPMLVHPWNRDPKLTQLKAWIGPADAEVYAGLWAKVA